MPDVLTSVEGRVGTLTLNRPEALNAVTLALATGLRDGLEELSEQADVIVIRGAGGTFCVGGDFTEVQRLSALGPDHLAELFAVFGDALALIAELPVPVIAAVEGHAMAGGFELLQASDVALVTTDAKLADNHANFAQVPGGGGSQYLPRLVGRQRATALILTGDRLTGAQAVEWGLAYRAVPPGELDDAVADLVGTLLKKGKSRTAATRTKRLIRDGLALPLEEGLALERRAVVEHISGDADAAAAYDRKAKKEQP